MKKNGFSLILGFVFIIVGVGYLGRDFLRWNFNLFFNSWWTLFLIIPSIYSMIIHKVNLFNSAVLAFGALKLIEAQGVLPHHSLNKLFIPALIILLGIYIISTAFNNKDRTYNNNYTNTSTITNTNDNANASNNSFTNQNASKTDSEYNFSGAQTRVDNNQPDYFCLLGGYTIKNNSTQLRPTTIFALFASVVADFSQANVSVNSEINIISIFSNIKFYPPVNANLVINSIPILGTIINNTTKPIVESYNSLKVDATTVLGTIEISDSFTNSNN